MAVPKYSKSKSKKRMRVAQWDGVEEPTASRCDNCNAPLAPHRVCAECGYYRGEKVLNASETSGTS